MKPPQVEMGQVVTLIGSRFSSDPADNKIWFGKLAVAPTSGTRELLEVRAPSFPAAGPVAVSVETSIGRSRSQTIVLLAPLRVTSVEPLGALPGDEVELRGNGFGEEPSSRWAGRPRPSSRPSRRRFASRCRSSRARRAASTR